MVIEQTSTWRRAVASWRGADPRRYNRLLAAVTMPPVLVMLILALTQQPLRGDLTRPGGYTEADFGWNQPQERFSPALVATRYDRPFDIVILGDSFSVNPTGQTGPGAFWTNYIAQRTGLSVVVLSMFDTALSDLLHHPVFVQSPPRFLIVQTVERYLVRNYVLEVEDRVGRFDGPCRPEANVLPPVPAFRPKDVQPVPWVRDTAPQLDFDQAANYLWKAVLRDTLRIDNTRVIRLALTRSDLFSSRVADQLLIYDDELLKVQTATAKTLDQVYCTLLNVQNRVQNKGQTRFLFMAVPDKASAYAEYLESAELRDLTLLPNLYTRAELNQVDLLTPLRQALRVGTKDVYMPNDTHWSSTAHRIAAESVVRTLSEGNDPQQ